METQERYHEYIKRKFKETRSDLDPDRRDTMEHHSDMEWIRVGETKHLKDNIQKIQLDDKTD